MAKLNVRAAGPKPTTHEGATAKRINPLQALRRSVMATMLWESQFYEDGESIADRIKSLVPKVKPAEVAGMAIDAREKMKLRHVPLLLVRELARSCKVPGLVTDTLRQVIQRPDELAEFLAIYWKEKKQPLSAQVKKGLALAFQKFSPYALAKYNRDGAIKLRDVLFLCHAKPLDVTQEKAWKQLVDGTLPIPDTWEVALSAGGNKKETWERLLKEGKLGGLALIRNLRNMADAKVDEKLIFKGLKEMKTERILPFRFISAARYAPQWEPQLEEAMFKCLEGREKLPGKTVLLVDVSGSMDDAMSGRSEMRRMDAATGLAVLLREVCEVVSICSFSDRIVAIPPRRGFALRDAICNSQAHSGTDTGLAVEVANKTNADRIIVLTDEQSHTDVEDPINKGYVINVASAENGIGYGKWLHVDGFSEAILDYIQAYEKEAGYER